MRVGTRSGTFTPSLAFGGVNIEDDGTAGTYTVQGGDWLLIDGWFLFNIYMNVTGLGGATGIATITGLPFTSKNQGRNVNALSVAAGNWGSAGELVQARVINDATVIQLRMKTQDTTFWTNATNTDFAAGAIAVSGKFRI